MCMCMYAICVCVYMCMYPIRMCMCMYPICVCVCMLYVHAQDQLTHYSIVRSHVGMALRMIAGKWDGCGL